MSNSMKLEKFLFPFAPKNKVSGIAIALHLAVYFAIAWIILQLTRRKVENFQIKPNMYYYAVYPPVDANGAALNPEYREDVPIPDGYYISNLIIISSGGNSPPLNAIQNNWWGAVASGSGGVTIYDLHDNKNMFTSPVSVIITQNDFPNMSNMSFGNYKSTPGNIRIGIEINIENGHNAIIDIEIRDTFGDGADNPGSGDVRANRNGISNISGSSSGSAGGEMGKSGVLYTPLLVGTSLLYEDQTVISGSGFGAGGGGKSISGIYRGGSGWIPTPGESTKDNTTISGALAAQGINIPYTTDSGTLGKSGIVIFEFTKLIPDIDTGLDTVPDMKTVIDAVPDMPTVIDAVPDINMGVRKQIYPIQTIPTTGLGISGSSIGGLRNYNVSPTYSESNITLYMTLGGIGVIGVIAAYVYYFNSVYAIQSISVRPKIS